MKFSISSRRAVVLIIAMSLGVVLLVVYSIFGTLLPTYAGNCCALKTNNLKQVHVFFRHGQRTPADTYPNDKYINETFSPFGWGQLTNIGRRQLYENGKWLRNRYDKFLGPDFVPGIVHAQSTEVSRAQMSLALVLAGLFPPKGTSLDWNKNLNWQPVPYIYQNLNQDDLLLMRIPCPRYFEELKRVEKESSYADVIAENKDLFAQLSNITGLQIVTLDDVQSLYSTLKAERDFGLKLPSWTNGLMDKLLNLTELSYIYNAYSPKLRQLKAGNFMKRTFADWEKASTNQKTPKIFVYSGHDSTVTNLLSGFNVWEKQFPDYGIMGILELHADPNVSGTFNVKIYLKRTENDTPKRLQVPGCNRSCPLEQMQILFDDIISENIIEECKPLDSSVTAPPPSGP